MVNFLGNDEGLHELIFLLANIKNRRYGVNNLNPLWGEIFIRADEFQQLGEYNDFLFLSKGFVDFFTYPKGLDRVFYGSEFVFFFLSCSLLVIPRKVIIECHVLFYRILVK